MSQRKVKFLLTGIFCGMGLIYLIVSAGMWTAAQTLSPEQLTAMEGDPEAFPVLHLVFGVLGTAFLAAGIGTYIGMSRRERRREEMFLYGSVVSGVVEKVKCNYAVRVNSRNPWHAYVACVHPVTREKITVRSHGVFDMTVKEGDSVRVAFDPLDEKKYAVEIPEREARA